MKSLVLLLLGAFAFTSIPAAEAPAAQAGATQILKWKDGKRACFLLAFDDSAPSQLKNVVPELEKRKLVGTFYLVTGNGLYASLKAKWEAAAKSPSVVVANHTFTHKGINSAAEIDAELAKCNEVLWALHPEQKQPRLLAFGKPGGVPWVISKEEQEAALARHHLVDRPPFAGPPMSYKTAEATLAVVDQALAKGEMGHLDFHGVGGDWLVTPVDWFTALLDKLAENREQLWITDAASWRKYVTEREGTQVEVVDSGEGKIRLKLTTKVDPALYDEPLTLSTKVPADWKAVRVKQGEENATVAVKDGVAVYSAAPGAQEVVLERN